MSKTLYHMLHDPIGNCEAMVTEYDEELINRAASNGMILIAVDEDGNRTVVRPEDVKELFTMTISPSRLFSPCTSMTA